jgi:hypothetical protein
MIYSLTWLPAVLEAAGLKVAEVDGWRSRGRAEMGRVRGVMCHHTATPRGGNMPTLNLLINGRPAGPGTSALPGPLSQLGLGRDGTFYVVAAGRANHAGAGRWEGVETGNSSFIGIEAENSGRASDPWPDVQMDAYRRGVAAILRHIGAGANMCCGHKEYAVPKGRKPDPSFDMPAFRAGVAELLVGKSPPPRIPAVDDAQRPTLRRGARGPFVAELQRLLGVEGPPVFGPRTEAALRAFQRSARLVPDGIAGPRTWATLVAAPKVGSALAAPAPAPAPPRALGAAAPAPATPATATPEGLPPADSPARPVRVDGSRVLTPDGRAFASSFRKGFVTNGSTTISEWLDTLPSPPPSINSSALRVLDAMCVIEGKLEAVNSWDGAHISFGFFQWTAGMGGDGELPVLLSDLKAADPGAFQDCLGQYGLDARVASPTATTGKLILGGNVLDSDAEKDVLRSPAWAYRFWRSGHHPSMRLAQLALAARRIKRFQDAKTANRKLRDWINSEYGIALILDQHINRPGHVPKTLEQAIAALGGSLPADPASWGRAEEQRLIDVYLDKRDETSMTDSAKRAAKVASFVRDHQISDERKSFVFA